LPTIYVNLEQDTGSNTGSAQGPQQPQQLEQAWDRYHIVRLQAKKDKRIVGDIKINPLGKTTQEQNVIQTNSQRLTGGWIKLTPINALDPGEYAVVEMLDRNAINTYVWDFGVNPSAPANAIALKPEPPALQK
jgi:hypothetical protein